MITLLFLPVLPLVCFLGFWGLHINQTKSGLDRIYIWCVSVLVFFIYFSFITGLWIGGLYVH